MTSPSRQAGGEALARAITVAASAAAAADAAPAELLAAHLEATAAGEQGLGSGSGPDAGLAAGANAPAAAATSGGAGAATAEGGQSVNPKFNPVMSPAEAGQRLFELRLALGRPNEAAAAVVAAAHARQHAGDYQVRPLLHHPGVPDGASSRLLVLWEKRVHLQKREVLSFPTIGTWTLASCVGWVLGES